MRTEERLLLEHDGTTRVAEPELKHGKRAVSSARDGRIRLHNFLTNFGLAGTEKQVAELTARLDKTRFDISFGCLKRWGPVVESLEAQQIPIREYHITRLYGVATAWQELRLAAALKRGHIDILHSYNFYSNVFSIPAARMAGVPCVIASIRDLGTDLSPRQALVHKWICKLADHLIVNADAIRDSLVAQGIAVGRISVIRNGVDMTRFDGHESGAALRHDFDLPDNAPLVVMLSRLQKVKGVEYFLEAAARIRSRIPEAHFLLVGDAFIRPDPRGEDMRAVDEASRVRIQNTAAKLGIADRLHLTGVRKDVPAVLAASAVSVLPSLSEGTSNTLLESMAAGVPVVATAVGGTPEVIADGFNGLLVPPRDAESLANAICEILRDRSLSQRLGAEGRRTVATNYSMDRMVRETGDLYMNLLGHRMNPI